MSQKHSVQHLAKGLNPKNHLLNQKRLNGFPLIRVRDLSISYQSQPALREVNLDIQAGQITALIGPSGCGKTSFLNCLNRLTDLIPDCHVEGSIDLEGLEISSQTINLIQLRKKVGMIFQKPNPFPISIRDNLHLPLKEHGSHSRAQRDCITEQVLQDVGLWDEVKQRLNQPALSLSGGQQQRLCIARALTLQPQVLLMDEPCSALDPLATETIEKLIQRLKGQYTIIIVTHNLAQAHRLADDLLIFWNRDGSGQLIEAGPAQKIFNNPQDADAIAYLQGRKG